MESRIFNKTNLLTRYFMWWKKFTNSKKMLVLLERIVLQLSFNKIYNHSTKVQRYQQNIKRFEAKRKLLMKFRVFNFLKQGSSTSFHLLKKCNDYIYQKNLQKKQFYFSVLNLGRKKKMIK